MKCLEVYERELHGRSWESSTTWALINVHCIDNPTFQVYECELHGGSWEFSIPGHFALGSTSEDAEGIIAVLIIIPRHDPSHACHPRRVLLCHAFAAEVPSRGVVPLQVEHTTMLAWLRLWHVCVHL